MARPDIKQDTRTFVSTLRKLGTSSGNGALRTALGWSETRYWKVHAALIDAGRVAKGRGRGGSVALV